MWKKQEKSSGYQCPMCKSTNVEKRTDKPAGIEIGGPWFLCLECGHRSLSMKKVDEKGKPVEDDFYKDA